MTLAMALDPGVYAAAGALLIAGLNELRARSRARAADLDHQIRMRDAAEAALRDQPHNPEE